MLMGLANTLREHGQIDEEECFIELYAISGSEQALEISP